MCSWLFYDFLFVHNPKTRLYDQLNDGEVWLFISLLFAYALIYVNELVGHI